MMVQPPTVAAITETSAESAMRPPGSLGPPARIGGSVFVGPGRRMLAGVQQELQNTEHPSRCETHDVRILSHFMVTLLHCLPSPRVPTWDSADA